MAGQGTTTSDGTKVPTNVIELRIITPIGVALEESVSSVTLPAEQGEIGILPGHIGYSGLLGVGVLSYESVSAAAKVRLVVSGGFCNFSSGRLTILADTVDLAQSTDKSLAAELRKQAESELANLSSSGSGGTHGETSGSSNSSALSLEQIEELRAVASKKLKRADAIESLNSSTAQLH